MEVKSTSLLTRPDYVDMINNELPIWLEEANDLSSTRWDWIKFKIKTSSIAYSKKVSKDRKQQEEELNFKYQSAFKRLQENPNDEARLEAENLKNELEALYDKKVEGIIIRSRVRWHEHGGKNSKYFLNLEKRDSIKKHIRELHVSGTISTNPFEIMDAQNRFYSKLYSKQTINLDGEDTKIFFENSNILRLSDELSASCEGKITLQECENILSSFQTDKTPGNDGLPIEFYKAFWPLIGKLMTE